MRVLLLFLLVPLAMFLTGCGEATDTGIEGRVTLDGNALGHGNVLAVLNNGKSISGPISADGTFVLRARDGESVPDGDYKVAVIAFEGPPNNDPEAERNLIVPRVYTEPERSGLSFSFPNSNEVKLELVTQ